MTTLILHVQEDAAFESRLQAALDLSRDQPIHLLCVQATPIANYVASDPFGGVFVMGDVIAQINARDAALKARVEARLRSENISWNWVHMDGDPAAVLVEQARLADLLIVSRAARTNNAPRQPLPLVEDVALHARIPVLVIPPEAKGFDASQSALVAWNGAPESAAALRAACPMLKKAQAVHLVVIGADDEFFPAQEAAVYLARHQIAATIHQRPAQDDVAQAIMHTAQELGAGYIVMGAYGHSRLREFLVGGVTRALLGQSPLPLLIAH